MTAGRIAVVVFAGIIGIACGQSTQPEDMAGVVTTGEFDMAENNSDSQTLFDTLLVLANGSEQQLVELQQHLFDVGTLYRLDTEEEYIAEMPEDLNVAGLLQALMDRADESAQRLLVSLIGSPVWRSEDSRIELLIQALGTVQPASPDIITFWDQFSQPDDGFANLTIDTAINNGSPAAIEFVGRKLIDTRHSLEARSAWLYSSAVPHRNDDRLLAVLETSLRSQAEMELKFVIVDVIFDHRPEEWYSTHSQVFPPPRAEMTATAHAIVMRLVELLLQSEKLPDQQRDAVEATKREIEGLYEAAD